MKKLLPPLLWLTVLACLFFGIRSAVRSAGQWAVWDASADRTLFEVDSLKRLRTQDSVAIDSLRRVGKQALANADRQHRSVLQLKGTADSLVALLDSATDTPESLWVTTRALETTQAALGEALSENASLRASYAAQSILTQRLTVSEKQAWGAVDSLVALVRRVPGCPKIPILGISVPKVGIGVGVGIKGPGVMVGVVVPLGCR